jgi:AraC-like DNA-binding protein
MVAGLIRDDKRGREARDTTIESIAERLGMSVATLARRLREEGLTYMAVRDETYDEIAKDYLRRTDQPIEDVAERLGFSDSFSFRRFFRRINGCSPSTYRANSGGPF